MENEIRTFYNSSFVFLFLLYHNHPIELLVRVPFVFQSLGCLLYALCFYKSPFDYTYEKGDSVPLAVVSGRIAFPGDSPYPEVNS